MSDQPGGSKASRNRDHSRGSSRSGPAPAQPSRVPDTRATAPVATQGQRPTATQMSGWAQSASAGGHPGGGGGGGAQTSSHSGEPIWYTTTTGDTFNPSLMPANYWDQRRRYRNVSEEADAGGSGSSGANRHGSPSILKPSPTSS